MAARPNGRDKGKAPKRIWYRRVIPPGYERATLVLTGTSPLLMHSGEFDRESETFRAYYTLGQKRKKSLDDEARLRDLEWTLGLYLDEDIGPYIPGKNVKELIRESATKWRRGEDVRRSLAVVEYRVPLLYDGPREQAALWEAGYRYTAMIANSGPGSGRVARCRPMFEEWSLAVDLAFDPEELDFDFLAVAVERSRKFGLGDYRPEFGGFDTELVRGEIRKLGADGQAIKPVIRPKLQAHLSMLARVMVEA
jgi:hypothetical protein